MCVPFSLPSHGQNIFIGMKIRLGHLRRIIRETLAEAGGGVSRPPRPNVRNAMAPSMSDREQIGRNSIRSAKDEDEVAPHLQEPVYDKEDCWGPVPPKNQNPYAMPDPYTKDYSVLPTPQIRR